MKTDIKAVVKIYHNRYAKIFRNYYPAHGSTGFTERNLSVNFAEAMEAMYPSTFAWFEVPFGDGYSEHFDAAIFNMDTQEIFVVESKRFSNPADKLIEAASDISRIANEKNLDAIKSLIKNCDVNEFTFYAVILADVWLETGPKIMIYENWYEKSYNNIESISETGSRLINVEWHKTNVEILSAIYNNHWPDYYKLLIMVGEIPQTQKA
jgi:hypothetical protein